MRRGRDESSEEVLLYIHMRLFLGGAASFVLDV
jgi:hypothetical protein